MIQPCRNSIAKRIFPENSNSHCWQGPSFPNSISNRHFCTGGNYLRSPYRTHSPLTDHGKIDEQKAEAWIKYQEHARLAVFYLATYAATMPSTRKEASAASASSSSKASPIAHKRKRKPGEARYYAVRAGRIPGVYTTWDECQSMINGFAGAQCKRLDLATQRCLPTTPVSSPFNKHLALEKQTFLVQRQ